MKPYEKCTGAHSYWRVGCHFSYRFPGTIKGTRPYFKTPGGKQALGREAQAQVLVNRVDQYPWLCYLVIVRLRPLQLWDLFPHWTNGKASLSDL